MFIALVTEKSKYWPKTGGVFGMNFTVIIPHYRSVGRRQGSCAVFGGCSALSTDLAKANAFLHFDHKTQCNLNEKYIQRKCGNSYFSILEKHAL